jgi:hypothetical protein
MLCLSNSIRDDDPSVQCLLRRDKPHEAGEASTGNYADRKGDRTPGSVTVTVFGSASV